MQMALKDIFKEQEFLKICLDDHYVEVPVTSKTTCADILSYFKRSEKEVHLTELWRSCERPIPETECPVEILKQWGVHRSEVQFYIRHHSPIPPQVIDGRRLKRKQESKNTAKEMIPQGVDVTLAELQDMTIRQQQQIEAQQHVLVAKEQRLKFLKQQELKHQQVAAEKDRIQQFKEKVDLQESKLKRLKALRGQVNDHKINNGKFSTELDTIKSFFNEKEKELSFAVSKVEELTVQLEELRKGRINSYHLDNRNAAPSLLELDKLRSELLQRNKTNEQQNSQLAAHREVLLQRKEEMEVMDQRIVELQNRLKKKQSGGQQIFSNVIGNKNFIRAGIGKLGNRPLSANIAAVEPYIKYEPKDAIVKDRENNVYGMNKQDPKYQTLPYNIKFPPASNGQKMDMTTNGTMFHKIVECNDKPATEPKPSCNQSIDILPKETIQNTPEFTPSVGHATAFDAMQETLKDSSINTPIQSFSNQVLPHSLVNLTPKPYGSTFSTSMLANKPGIMSLTPPYNRISDSSQMSYPKTSTPLAPANSYPQENHLVHSTKDITSINDSQNPQTTQHELTNVTSIEELDFGKSKAWNQVNQSSAQNESNNSPVFSNSSSSPQTDVSSAISVLIAGPSKTTVNTKPSYRYAPKSVIANTYMRRLGPGTLDQYRKNMTEIYSQLIPNSNQGAGDSDYAVPAASQTAKVKPLNVSNDQGFEHNQRDPEVNVLTEDKEVDSQSRNLHSFDMDVERMRYKPNAPKLRRRLSSGESDELSRNMWLQQKKTGQSNDLSSFQAEKNESVSEKPDVISLEDLQDSYNNNSEEVIPIDVVEQPREGEPAKHENPPKPHLHGKKGNLKTRQSINKHRRVSFDPLALLLDASLEGELGLVMQTAHEVTNPSAANDEGITALHNAICAGHFDIVKFLVEFGCNVNSPDSDGWTPLHCAASCNNLAMVKLLVEHGACIFATTISDQETAAEKCEEDEDGYDGCSEYLYNIQEKLGIINKGIVYGVFNYVAENEDELTFVEGDSLLVLRKGDEHEKDWWWAKLANKEGYIPRNLLGLYPRIKLKASRRE